MFAVDIIHSPSSSSQGIAQANWGFCSPYINKAMSQPTVSSASCLLMLSIYPSSSSRPRAFSDDVTK